MLVKGPEGEIGVQAGEVCFAHCPDSTGPPGAREVQAALEQSGMQVLKAPEAGWRIAGS